jgi:ankyrin repeat protein
MYACARGDLAITKLLLSNGADTKAKDSTGRAAAKHISGPFENELRELLAGSNKKGVTK